MPSKCIDIGENNAQQILRFLIYVNSSDAFVPRVTAVVIIGDQTESDAICKETSYGYVLSNLGYNNNYMLPWLLIVQ